MPRYVAFLRGVSPLNLKMTELRTCLEQSGFTGVRTVLASGNAVFDVGETVVCEVERAVTSAMQHRLGKSFHTIVRPVNALAALLGSDPFAGYGLPAEAKRVVSFLGQVRAPRVPLPLTEGTATVIHQRAGEVFTAYLPSPNGPVFMKLIERAYGTDVTTRTWDTVTLCAAA